MSNLFGSLFFISLLALIIGLFKPTKIIFWGDKQKRSRKRVALYYGLSAFIFMILTGATAPSTDTSSTPSPKEQGVTQTDKTDDIAKKKKADETAKKQADTEAKAKTTEETKKKAMALKHNGTSDTVTKPFQLDAGYVIFTGSYTGNSNFVVELLDSNGNKMNLLVNTIGDYRGKTLALIPDSGKYVLKITAKGQWHFNGTQDIPSNPSSAPTTLKGHGDDVMFVHLTPGLKTFTAKNKGQENFIVQVNERYLLFNKIGNYSGQTANKINDDGTYIISIKSDGDWSIKIS